MAIIEDIPLPPCLRGPGNKEGSSFIPGILKQEACRIHHHWLSIRRLLFSTRKPLNSSSIINNYGFNLWFSWSNDHLNLFLYQINSGAKTSVIVASSFTKTWIEGPAVSLNGSPTVSPTTAALWVSD